MQDTVDGTRVELGPNEVVIKLSGEETDDAFSLCEYTAPPDGPSPPPHVHEETDEVLYVLEGTVECVLGDETLTAASGEAVYVPRATLHTFSPAGDRQIRMLVVYSPGGFEEYFLEMGEYLESLPSGPPDMDKVQQKAPELSEVYDQTIPEAE